MEVVPIDYLKGMLEVPACRHASSWRLSRSDPSTQLRSVE